MIHERSQPFERRPGHYPVVAVGCDTLHYTAPIELKRDVVARLENLQAAAREGRGQLLHLGEKRAGRNVVVAALPFLMLPHSTKRYRWGVQCEPFGLTVWLNEAKGAGATVKVELGSRVLWHFGQEEAYRLSRRVVNELCEVGDGWPARPSRVDFAVDFQGVNFCPDMKIHMASRARRRPQFSHFKALCPGCDGPYLDADAKYCGRCGAERTQYVASTVEVPYFGHEPEMRELDGKRAPGRPKRTYSVPCLTSAERSPNPHLLSRGAALALGALPMQLYGGTGRHPFTGWEFGRGEPLMVRIYDKTREIVVNSPEKVWFYDVWNRSDGYAHSYCSACGAEHAKAIVLPADAPFLVDEIPKSSDKVSRRQREIRALLGLPEELVPRSLMPRVAERVCTLCDQSGVHRRIPVWRLEVQVRWEFLQRIAPDGEHAIETVDDVIKNADELWLILVGQAQRECPKCKCTPIGTAQRWRVCRNCIAARELELGRPLAKEETREFALRRRRGWIEARDGALRPDGDPSRFPLCPWWQHLQTVHFEFSAPATATSAKLPKIVSADVNKVMARGCITSWAHATDFVDQLERELGRMPTPDEFKAKLWERMFGDQDPLELYALVAQKDARVGKRVRILTPAGRAPPPRPPPPAEKQPAPSDERRYREVNFQW